MSMTTGQKALRVVQMATHNASRIISLAEKIEDKEAAVSMGRKAEIELLSVRSGSYGADNAWRWAKEADPVRHAYYMKVRADVMSRYNALKQAAAMAAYRATLSRTS